MKSKWYFVFVAPLQLWAYDMQHELRRVRDHVTVAMWR